MKITLVSTFDKNGGAAVACNRLAHALANTDADVKMLVRDKNRPDDIVVTTTNSWIKKALNFWRFAYERFCFLFYEKSKEVRFAFSMANTGENIAKHSLIRQADVINMHWVHFGFLSLKSIEKLIALNKPIVWTLHDMWAFTGGCHYTGDCTAFKRVCGQCPYLKRPALTDLSNKIWNKKFEMLRNADVTFVASSKWLANTAFSSKLLKGFRIEAIPIPVNTDIFTPKPKDAVRKKLGLPQHKKLLLFGAMNVADKRKGFRYFLEALQILKKKKPEATKDLEIVLFGKSNQETVDLLPYPTKNLSFLNSDEKIAEAFNAVDLFTIPSLQDNLPNIIMESLACGTPVAGFKTGGIPEMIDHKSCGYLADFKSSEDLAQGIYWSLFEADSGKLREKSREKILREFTEAKVAERYLHLYKDVMRRQ